MPLILVDSAANQRKAIPTQQDERTGGDFAFRIGEGSDQARERV
jgi:hypothetical protein